MIGDPYAKVGLAAVMVAGLWGVGVAVDRLGARRLVLAGGREGALTPEAPLELPPPDPDRPEKHTALVAVSAPRLTSIEPGSIRVTTAGYNLDEAQVHPITEFVKEKNPQPRSIMLLMDNSKSMVIDSPQGPASDPGYRRLDAGRLLLESLPNTDLVSIACFPCRRSVEDQVRTAHTTRPFELLAPPERADFAETKLEALRDEENGSTPLYRAIVQAADRLAQTPSDRKRMLVLLTDGNDTDEETNGLERAKEAVKAANLDMYAVGLGSGADMKVLKTIAGHTLRADDASALRRAFRDILLQMSRKVVQIDMDVVVARDGRPIPPGQKIQIAFRSGGKLYTTEGVTQ